jgi:hypothetical protein
VCVCVGGGGDLLSGVGICHPQTDYGVSESMLRVAAYERMDLKKIDVKEMRNPEGLLLYTDETLLDQHII